MTALDVLFVSGDIGGNVPPTLAIAGQLARRGHRVTLAGLRPRPGEQLPEGIVEIPVPALGGLDVTRNPGRLGHLPALARMSVGRTVMRDVRNVLTSRRWDAVVIDAVMLTSIRESLRLGLPTAALFHSLGSFWSKGLGSTPVNLLLRPMGIAPLKLLKRADVLLLPTDPLLDQHGGTHQSRFTFEWLGTTERAVPPEPRTRGASLLVLVSLSTAWQKKQGALYRRIITALENLTAAGSHVRAVLTTGGAQLEGTLTPQRGIEIRGRSPHSTILPHADLVIGHGGHSTTLRALAHGVPMLVIPLDPMSDQPTIGKAVAAAGVGRMISRRSNSVAIREAVIGILEDRTVAKAAALTGERLRRQRGDIAGADRIELMAASRR